MFIEFEKLIFRNVQSYGSKPTEIDFKKGLHLITGTNGQGKSSIIQALTFNLYGKPYTKIKINELINRINQKDLYTESHFRIGNDKYKIVRGLKPDILKIERNDKKVESLSSKNLTQDEIDKILGVDYILFKNIVSLAVSYNKPYLTLSAQEKREIIESIFNVRVFGEMLKALKKRLTVLKVTIEVSENNIKNSEKNIMEQKRYIEEIKKSKISFEENIKSELESIEKELTLTVAKIDQYKNEILGFNTKLTEMNDLKSKEKSVLSSELTEKKSKLASELETLEKRITEITEENAKKIVNLEQQLESINEKSNNELDDFIKIITDKKLGLETKEKEYEQKIIEFKIENKNEYNNKLLEIIKNKNEIESLIKNSNFRKDTWSKKEFCYECESKIDDSKRAGKLEEIEKSLRINKQKIDNLLKQESEIKVSLLEIEKKENELKDIKNEQEKIKKELSRLGNEIVMEKLKIENKFNSEKQTLQNQINIIKNGIDVLQIKTKISELKNDKNINDLENKLNTIDLVYKNEENNLNNKINTNFSFIENCENNTKQLNSKKEQLKIKKFDINVEEIEKEFDEKCENYKKEYQEHKVNLKQLDNYNKVSEILSDNGIKSYFFSKLIPILNKKINDYLNKFNLPIIIQFDQSMEETIKSLNGRDVDISYFSFSGGERKRIDLSILFSFIDIMKSITNFSCNVLFADEVIDGEIDSEGLENIIESIKNLVDNAKNFGVYIISHKLQNYENIDSILRVEKRNSFSQLIME